jgi:6-pyruvoyl-tetrahydropterin synthase related domain
MVATRPAPTGATTDAVDAGAPPTGHRPVQWWDRLETWVGVGVVAVCCVFVLFQLQPDLLLRNTTTAGGDTGAHVWWPAFLRDHLLPQGRIAGWAPDWYAGFPAGQFYFPLPALLIVTLDTLVPYSIAFKLVTALGAIALPAAAYVFGRGLRAPSPAPALFAVGATIFLFFKGDPGTGTEATQIAGNQRIMGGNLASTLAGEYSFTLALALGLFFLGALAYTLDHRRRLWLPAVLLGATIMSHLVVAMFVVVGAVIVWLARRPRRNLGTVVAIAGVGGLLTAVWTFPLLATLGYTTDMGYEPIRAFRAYMFPWYPAYVLWILPLVVIAVVGGIVHQRRVTLELAALTAAMGLAFWLWEGLTGVFSSTPVWNLRLLPFWYLGLILLAMLGAAELARGAAALMVRAREPSWAPRQEDSGRADHVSPSTVLSDLAPVATVSPERDRVRDNAIVRALTIVVVTVLAATAALWRVYETTGLVTFWAEWNYSGYERTGTAADTKVFPEYRALVDTLDELPPGRAMWEGGSSLGVYGTSIALMLLPYWTDGRIASMEGLYFESSATTPYHFMTVATLAGPGNASNPQVGLPYRSLAEFDVGVRYLQKLGVRYYVVHSDEAKQQAARSAALVEVATSPDTDGQPPLGWTVYEVREAPLVEALTVEPAVAPGVSAGDWQDDIAVPWWNAPTRTPADARDLSLLDRPFVADGPPRWKRARPPGLTRAEAPDRKLPASDAVQKRSLPPVAVTDVRTTDHSVSFRVSRTGVPVMVKTSYFPNWTAHGADGPWRATPNYMVVVPTSRDVRLEYSTTTAENLGRAGTAAGVVGVAGLAAWPWWRKRRSGPRDGPDRSAAVGEHPPAE